MLGIAGLFLAPMLPIEHNIELRIVESGSMEPAIMTGAMIVVRPAESYAVGDVIMFKDRGARVPTTHRIVDTYSEGGRTWFVTKGDANEEADTGAVAPSDVIGTVAIAVPRVGFVLDFARQPLGFMLLIVLPAGLIVLSELEKIWRELRRRRSGSASDASDEPTQPEPAQATAPEAVPSPAVARPMMDIGVPVRYFVMPTLDLRGVTPYRKIPRSARRLARWTAATSVVVFSVLVASSAFLGSTVSYFNDIERSFDNALRAIALDFQAVPDGSVFTFLGSDIQDDDGAVVVNVMPTGASVDVRYDVSAHVVGTTTELCDSVIADSVTPISYAGEFISLAETDITFDSPWELAFSLIGEAGLVDGDDCDIALTFSAWHYDELLDQGYFDEEIIELSFSYDAPLALEAASFSGTALSVSATQETLPGDDDSPEKSEEVGEVEEGAEETNEPAIEPPEKPKDPEPTEPVEEAQADEPVEETAGEGEDAKEAEKEPVTDKKEHQSQEASNEDETSDSEPEMEGEAKPTEEEPVASTDEKLTETED